MSQPQRPISPGMRAVLDRTPPWYERWGTSLVTGLVAALVALAAGVRYPDEVTAPATVAPGVPLLAWADLPLRDAGQVRPGQRVQLYLPAFPAGQFGPLPGTVAATRPGPKVGYTRLTIRLARGLRPSAGQLPPPPPLVGTAHIITQEASLLDRVLRPMRQLLATRF